MGAIETQYPPEVYAAAPPEELVRAPQTPLWVWFTLTAAVGIPAGLVWWMAAPGGAFYGGGSTGAWLPRDLALGLIGILCGLVVGLMAARQRFAIAAAARTTTAVAGSALGSLIAWLGGEWTASLAGSTAQAAASASAGSVAHGFSLASYGILLLWPAAAALTVFGVTMISMLRTARAA